MDDKKSILKQIRAMDSWAIQVLDNFKSQSFSEAENFLRLINTQGRRLEWRHAEYGREYGLKHLPELEEVKALKQKISEARAAAQKAKKSLEHLRKIAKKSREKSPAEMAAIGREIGWWKKEAGKTIFVLVKLLEDAKEIADGKPWLHPMVLSKPANRRIQIEFLHSKGYYGSMPKLTGKRIEITAGMRIRSLPEDMAGTSLRGANFVGANLRGVNLSGADLVGAVFMRTDVEGAKFDGADVDMADFEGSNITLNQLRKAKNWQKAITDRKLTMAIR